MNNKKPLRIGLVGYGFMGRTHSNAYRQVSQFFDVDYRPELKAVCGRDQRRSKSSLIAGVTNRLRPMAIAGGSQRYRSDRHASPNDTHAVIAVAAAKAGKIVLCEKPLGRDLAEAKQMVDAVERAKVPNMVWYNYRRVPAVTLAKQIVDEGKMGRVFHYRAKFLQDWTISAKVPLRRPSALASESRRRRAVV